jgi:predicted RNA methylase
MATSADVALREGFATDADRKKRLGQYLTGVRLARLLAALAGAETAASVIDPMAGTGDMLVGCREHGAAPALMGAVEIDPIAHAACVRRLSEAGSSRTTVLLGNAFSPESLAALPTSAWDIVITNPPYVRYQSTARASTGELRLPSALEIRQGLISVIDELSSLDDTDKVLFCRLAASYSGLADLAVPAWILCASLVRLDGRLAMLVPTTWLNRDYAHPIQYLLARWFDVEVVVEDADASWFSEALVRTTLVVARRVERRETAFAPLSSDGHIYLKLCATAADDRSIVGALYASENDPDASFAAGARSWHTERAVPTGSAVKGTWIPSKHTADVVRRAIEGEGWLARLEGRARPRGQRVSRAGLPLALSTLIPRETAAFVSLEELGWRAGQGLRTGANEFFYAEAIGDSEEPAQVVSVSRTFGGGTVAVPRGALLPVLRRQSELPSAFVIYADEVKGRVLVLDRYALPEDVDELGGSGYLQLPEPLAEHVRTSARVNIGSDHEPKVIPSLSAVVTNVRPPATDRAPRFWYQLPPLRDRHRPSLAVARVNHRHPRAFLNAERKCVIDANFSTIWPSERALVDEFALLTILNSAWCAAALELSCTVMGGGALKVEAAHLRRLPLPCLEPRTWKELSELGQRLASSQLREPSRLLNQMDSIVIGAICKEGNQALTIEAVRRLAANRLTARSPRRD